jgi:hypothetical protein
VNAAPAAPPALCSIRKREPELVPAVPTGELDFAAHEKLPSSRPRCWYHNSALAEAAARVSEGSAAKNEPAIPSSEFGSEDRGKSFGCVAEAATFKAASSPINAMRGVKCAATVVARSPRSCAVMSAIS